MSKYTTTIRDILESYLTEEEKFSDLLVADIINKTMNKFFNFPFEWYSDDNIGLESFKRDFLLRYYNQYIGFETLGMFKTAFMSVVNLNMPKYKALFIAMSNGYDPLVNYDMHYDHHLTNDDKGSNEYSDTGTTKSTTDTDYQSIESDNPQVTIANNDYASSMTRGENNSTNNSTGSSTHKGEDTKHTDRKEDNHDYGLTGKSQVDAISEFRAKYINLNKEIIDSCQTLFLAVW